MQGLRNTLALAPYDDGRQLALGVLCKHGYGV